MRILYVTTISGTVNAFLIPHIKNLIEQGHTVDVLFNPITEPSKELIDMGCKIHAIPFQRSPLNLDNFKAYKRIKSIVENGKYNLIHTHTPIASFLVRFACKNIKNLKIIYTAHGFHFYKSAPLKSWLLFYPIEKIISRYTDAIITINNEDFCRAKKFKLRGSGQVYKISGVGIDLKKFSPGLLNLKKELRNQYGFNFDDYILFYAAELNYNKHQDFLINAIAKLQTIIPNIKLLLAGDGPLKVKYMEMVKSMKLENNVIFLGYRKDISSLLEITDIVVSSSRREGLPVNIMEAMAKGLPCIVTNCRGNRDLVINGKTGYVVDDMKGFIEATKDLFYFKEKRDEFGSNGKLLVENYSIENVLLELNNIYHNVINIPKKEVN